MEQFEERLRVDHFAGIKQLDLEVWPFTVLIGPQSVGKSVTAKLLYFFRNIPRFLLDSALNEKPLPPEETVIEKFKSFFPLPIQAGGICSLSYEQGGSTVHLERATSEAADWKVFLPDALENAFSTAGTRLSTTWTDLEQRAGLSIMDEALAEYSNALADIFPVNTTNSRFIPAGRSFYAQVQANMASFFKSSSLDPFVTEFGIYIARLRMRVRARTAQATQASLAAHGLSEYLLNGEHVRVSNEDFIETRDGRQLPASLWSSGQQEAQPLAFVLQHYCQWPGSATPLFIEEPEAHLFPASQRMMTEFIALAFNTGQPVARMFLTTHSPYILTTVNNLLLAGQIHASDAPSEAKNRLADLVPTDRALAPGSVGAFMMDQNGCRSIMDEETGLIDANAIDEVSERLNDTFEALLDLQYHP